MIHDLVAALRFLGTHLRPILPESSVTLLAALGGSADDVTIDVPWGTGVAGATVTKPPALFPRKEEQAPG